MKKHKFVFLTTAILFAAVIAGSFLAVFLSYRISAESEYSKIEFEKLQVSDPNFIEGKKYIIPGNPGYNVDTKRVLGIQSFRLPLTQSNQVINPTPEYTFTGGLTIEQLKEFLQTQLTLVLTEIAKDTDAALLEGLALENIALGQEDEFTAQANLINIGYAEVFMSNCNFYNELPITYNLTTKNYILTNTAEFKANLCAKYVPPTVPEEATCTDCTLYPADKLHRLRADYAIEVINADGVPGAQRFAVIAYSDLLDLYSAATNAGYNMRLTSAYRSYTDQQNVYEVWVQYEMGFGKSRAQAESDANSYSALPGFSEHQLGTTADISSLDCIGIETMCYSNEVFWQWLKENAHNYGFVMSYAPGKDNVTGYIYEPWHYRWIGVELATEFKHKYESRSYLAEFLRNKKLY